MMILDEIKQQTFCNIINENMFSGQKAFLNFTYSQEDRPRNRHPGRELQLLYTVIQISTHKQTCAYTVIYFPFYEDEWISKDSD